MTNSTLGFIYTPDFYQVLLIEKQRPVFHKGKLNGLGGKFEVGEDGLQCISREVAEESGLKIPPQNWKKIGTINWEEWAVEIFVAIYRENREQAVSLTSDLVAWYPVKELPKNIVSNLSWLIPLGIDCLSGEESPMVEVNYSK